jgi:peptidoglycan/xylan/chitin deacetylase (PgdA/CDA1 family)
MKKETLSVLHAFIACCFFLWHPCGYAFQGHTSFDDASKLKDSAAHFIYPEIPVLCYHQICKWNKTDSKNARSYIMSPEKFKRQIKILRDSGYRFILPDELVSIMASRRILSQKVAMLTFDDGTESQLSVAVPELNKYNIKALFFLMTVVLDRPGYLTSAQVKDLSARGHQIGGHTWDHHAVTGYVGQAWKKQIELPKQKLEKILGKPVRYFAYPYGTWNREAISFLKKMNYKAAFQLNGKRDADEPLFTIRRILVDGYWEEKRLLKEMKIAFRP